MFNFYVLFAGHDVVTDAGRATMRRRKFKTPSLRKKVQKMKDLPKTWVFMGKQFEDFRRKKTLPASTKQPRGTHRPWKQQLNMVFVNSKK